MSKFIVFEGADGCGKSTAFSYACEYLSCKGYDVVPLVPLGSNSIGKQIREILLDPNNMNISPITELLLYVASIAQSIDETIKPNLKSDKIIVCDRFYPSTYIYQSLTGDYSPEEINNIISQGVREIKIDKLIVLDIDTDTAMSRMGNKLDRMEQKGPSFHSKVRQCYLDYEHDNKVIIDGSKSIDDVKKDVFEILDEIIGEL